MYESLSKLSLLAVLSTVGASNVYADSHHMGRMQDAIPNCGQAVQRAIGLGETLKYDDRVVLTGTRHRVQTVKLSGTLRDGGEKISFEARCERGAKGRAVASVSYALDAPAIAEATTR